MTWVRVVGWVSLWAAAFPALLAAQGTSGPADRASAPPACVAAEPAGCAAADSPAPAERIVARRMAPGAGKALLRLPLVPFLVLGKGFERGLLFVEERRLQLRLRDVRERLRENHLNILTGGLGPGTGFALGVEIFDENFLARGVSFRMPLRYSTHNYQQAEFLLRLPLAPRRRVFLEFGPRYRSRPQEDFFGLGPDSREDDRTNYHLQERSVAGAIGATFGPSGRVDVHARYVNANVLRGKDPRFPSTASVFPALEGLARGASLLRYGVGLAFAPLDDPRDPKKGFRGAARFDWVDSRNSDPFRFYDYGFSAEGYLPLGGPRTLAVRVLGDFRRPRGAGQVPFFLLPYLGGQQTMRGFREFRFYDRNALLINAEYRYRVWKYIDVVLFADHGQVAPRAGDLAFGNFKVDAGGGLRVKTRKGVAFRFDVGHSKEGTRFYWTFSPEF